MKRFSLVLALALFGCPKPAPVATAEDAAVPSATASTTASAPASASVAAPLPLPPDASRADREKSVLALLRGTGAAAIGERATDPGKTFDENLRDRVAPPRNVYLRQESVAAVGSVDKANLERELRRALDPFRTCYERALEKKATLEGQMTLRFDVAAGGAISAVTDTGAKPSEDLAACAKKELVKVEVPAAKSPLKVTQVVRFSLSPLPPD